MTLEFALCQAETFSFTCAAACHSNDLIDLNHLNATTCIWLNKNRLNKNVWRWFSCLFVCWCSTPVPMQIHLLLSNWWNYFLIELINWINVQFNVQHVIRYVTSFAYEWPLNPTIQLHFQLISIFFSSFRPSNHDLFDIYCFINQLINLHKLSLIYCRPTQKLARGPH